MCVRPSLSIPCMHVTSSCAVIATPSADMVASQETVVAPSEIVLVRTTSPPSNTAVDSDAGSAKIHGARPPLASIVATTATTPASPVTGRTTLSPSRLGGHVWAIGMRMGICTYYIDLSHRLLEAICERVGVVYQNDLAALACIWILLKYEDDGMSGGPGARQFVRYLDRPCAYDDLLDMEGCVLRVLKWNVYACVETAREGFGTPPRVQ